jgi:predicted nucleic acid-binding protein
MDKPRFMLDSNVIIDHLNSQLNLTTFLDQFPLCEVYINLVVEIEALAKPGMTMEEEVKTRAFLARFKRIEIDNPARDEAIRIRRNKVLLLPDALIAASAIILNATVLSNDPHLRDFQWPGYAARPCVPASH